LTSVVRVEDARLRFCRPVRSLPAILKTVGQVPVHVLYKQPEIGADKAIPAIVVSVT
jgi:hypothetical protein